MVPVQIGLWRVDGTPAGVRRARIPLEKRLEDIIESGWDPVRANSAVDLLLRSLIGMPVGRPPQSRFRITRGDLRTHRPRTKAGQPAGRHPCFGTIATGSAPAAGTLMPGSRDRSASGARSVTLGVVPHGANRIGLQD
ncbi:hypothetical protein C5E41_00145 [Nocardia nova]|nr:hypothetical protein C5E41_00145 [Nocardia nova]